MRRKGTVLSEFELDEIKGRVTVVKASVMIQRLPKMDMIMIVEMSQ